MSTVRAFSNNKRVSTGKTMKDGSFLQFYPTKTRFENEAAWKEDWKKKSHVKFEEEEDEYADMPPLIRVNTNLPMTPTSAPPPPRPRPRPQRNETVTVTTTTTTQRQTTSVKQTPRCCICVAPIGQDHRMCIVEMMRSGIPNFMEEWHIRSGLQARPTTPSCSPIDTPELSKTPPPKEVSSHPPPVARKKKENKEENMEDWDFKAVKSATLPAGKYYIGDICYFLKDKTYDQIYGGTHYESGLYTRKADGAVFMVDNTAYGDGLYKGTDDYEYGVDAGIIGIVSRSLGPEKDDDMYGGTFNTFKEPVHVKFGGGVFRFNSPSKYIMIDSVGNTYNSDEDW